MTDSKTKILTVQVPTAMAEKVDALAAQLECSPAWIVNQALGAWIEREDERTRLTREAMDDVDAGRLIDHQTVQAWVDSLGTDTPKPVPRVR